MYFCSMKHLIVLCLMTLVSVVPISAQRYVNNYPDAGKEQTHRKHRTPSDRDSGMVMRFGLEGGSIQMATINLEYEINPFFSTGIGVGGAYHLKSAWGVPIYAELRCYAPNRKYSGYVSLRLGYMAGVGKGKHVLTAQELYGHPLTTVDKLGGFMATMGLGFSYKRFDFGGNFGLSFGNFHKYCIIEGQVMDQWFLPRKAYMMATFQVSYSMPLYHRPYNKVVKKN